MSESFEVDDWVVKVSGQSRDIFFKKTPSVKKKINAKQSSQLILTKQVAIFASSQLLLTTLISIYHLSTVWHLELFPKCIERNYILVLWLPGPWNVKKYDFQKLKTFKRWVSHEFSQNQKIVMDGFPWSLGTETKYCFSWELKS